MSLGRRARTLAAIQERSGRPVIAVRREYAPEPAGEFHVEAQRLGVGSFFSVPDAAHAVDTLLRWRERREGLPEIL